MIRTDLAMECTENLKKTNQELLGISVEEFEKEDLQLHVTKVHVMNKQGEERLKKPKGRYFTIESSLLVEGSERERKEIAKELAKQIKQLLPKQCKRQHILVAGLGNREITPDALGPEVVGKLDINRHLPEAIEKNGFVISALVPGVMAQTGMETSEILRGVIKETKPELLVAIDALAARSVKRLNRTIQITDTGICPGSGVRNHRIGLQKETLGIPVIGIGVPTVIDAKKLFVTPKDVDTTIQMLAQIISGGLNMAFRAYTGC